MKNSMKHNAYLPAAGLVLALAAGRALAYDPLAVPEIAKVTTKDFTVTDASRKREIPVRIYLPAQAKPAPVVLFSHGLGGSRNGNAFMGEHWAARGYVAVFLQHPGSDTSVWREKPISERMPSMVEAASPGNFLLRVRDVPAVINQLQTWNTTPGHSLQGRLDLTRIGMSGHSFGAITTQAVSGQQFLGGLGDFRDQRIKAAIAFSPSSPQRGDAKSAFGEVKIPWMLMTGTKDVAPIGHADVPSRRAVFTALPPGSKYEVVLDNAEHSAFTDVALPGDREKRNPNHHRAILALSTAFWDAYLRGDEEAKSWLNGDAPRTILDPKDEWHRK